MTWLYGGFGGGETRDALIEGCKAVTGAGTILAGGMDIITSPVKYGVGALRIPSGQVGGASLMETCASTKMYCFQAWGNYNGNPTATVSTIFRPAATGFSALGMYALEVNTSRQARIIALNANYPTSSIPLTDWSVGVLGNGAYTHLVWIFDPLTLGTDHVWHTVLIDNVVQICADLGVWPTAMNGGAGSGYALGTTVDVGVDLRLDDIAGLSSTSSADAPHLAAVPVVTVDAQHPASDVGAQQDWAGVPVNPSSYANWDDATGNDGDTSYAAVGPSYGTYHQDSLMESLATLGWDASATILQYAAGVGPVASYVHKTASTKFNGSAICDLATTVSLTKPGAAYEGGLQRLTRSGGGSWARADVDALHAGAQLDADGDDAEWRITSFMLQWCICNNVYLPLTPPPMIPQSTIF